MGISNVITSQKITLNNSNGNKINKTTTITIPPFLSHNNIKKFITSIIDYILAIVNLCRLMKQMIQQGRYIKQNPSWSLLSAWDDRVAQTPHHNFISFVSSSSSSLSTSSSSSSDDNDKKSSSLTYRDVDDQSNRMAHVILSLLTKSSCSLPPTVALFLPNTPSVIISWLGIAKMGGTASLINGNLRGKSLAHAIKTSLTDSSDRILIVGEGSFCKRCLEDDEVRMVLDSLKVTVLIKSYDGRRRQGENDYDNEKSSLATVSSLDKHLSHVPSSPVTPLAPPSHQTPLLTIYTSGTTGLPKASIITHLRFWSAGLFLSSMTHLTKMDRIYCPLPLYHSSGGMMGVGSCILSGACLVLREKFSARSFARDLVSERCSIVLYIGELARFALAAKETRDDEILRRTRPVRAAFGNGMRGDVWEPFRQRFGIERIYEFYGSTEGNATLINNTTKPHALGFIPPPFLLFYPVMLAKTDPITGDIIRDHITKRVIPARVGECGQLLGKIIQTDPTRKFEGYTDANATKKKIVRDVKEKGDEWFLSGDLLRRDVWGFYYWVDRIGDTFRWKGENVSTAEVQEAFTSNDDDNRRWQVNVYGVEVDGYEGRTGMARIVLDDDGGSNDDTKDDDDIPFDGKKLYENLDRQLPRYAIPMFLRVTVTQEKKMALRSFSKSDEDDDADDDFVTCTFKNKKTNLVKEGFNPKLCRGEVVYWRDDRRRKFVVMTEENYNAIMTRKIKI